MAHNANRYLGINNSNLSKNLEKLSSGYQINRAADNAAGLAVSEKMRTQIAGITQAVRNNEDGISMVQTYEGALTETHKILQRMKTLATQMANGTYDDEVDRASAQLEFTQLNSELDQIADTDFNGVVALNGGTMADGLTADPRGNGGKFLYREQMVVPEAGTVANYSTNVSVPNAFSAAAINLNYTSTIVLQAGGRTKDSVNFTFYYTSNGIGDLSANMDVSSRTQGLGTANLSISSQGLANYAMDQIDFAINKVSLVRATFGAIQNRLEHKIDNLNVTLENLTAAESRIRDTDMATMMMEFTKNQILSQASQSMLAQANMLPQSILSLLQ
jgi:flagellin